MSNDVIIQPASMPIGITGTAPTTAHTAGANAGPSSTETSIPNPTLRLDAALGIVVIEFRTASGQISGSIPTERQLEAYRASALSSSDQSQTIQAADGPPEAWYGVVT
jgi:hypothetical protein